MTVFLAVMTVATSFIGTIVRTVIFIQSKGKKYYDRKIQIYLKG